MNKEITVTITGAKGAGKSRVAEIIHAALTDLGQPFEYNDGGREPQTPMRLAPGVKITVNVEQF